MYGNSDKIHRPAKVEKKYLFGLMCFKEFHVWGGAKSLRGLIKKQYLFNIVYLQG